MVVETKFFTFAEKEKFILENGQSLGPVTIAYETYGKLNADKTNAILVLHAFSGDAHAAGFHKGKQKPGWWDELIGTGKALDTDKYFVISSNVIGGCAGSTGPSSINPETGKAYGLSFPNISIWDMVNCQKIFIDSLGIEKLHCILGGSMGGMQALAWLSRYPDSSKSFIPIATALKHSSQQIAFNEVGRQAIMADPNWNNGDYYGGDESKVPARGLSVARMLGHITFMSEVSMSEKFGRQRKGNSDFQFTAPEFEVEGYLHYNGNNFVKRFDANSYLYITKAMDNFETHLSKTDAKVLVLSFKSDWLYPPEQSKEIVRLCKSLGIEVSYCEISSTYGHDAFLLEVDQETHLIRHFLKM